jgi:hypothetical protein
MKKLTLLLVSAALCSCVTQTVHVEDLDAWKNIPVIALDTHTLFATLPMTKQISSDGIEIRNYSNGRESVQCSRFGNFTRCNSSPTVCSNLFYISKGKVLEYAPTGACKTDETVRPQERYKSLTAPLAESK